MISHLRNISKINTYKIYQILLYLGYKKYLKNYICKKKFFK